VDFLAKSTYKSSLLDGLSPLLSSQAPPAANRAAAAASVVALLLPAQVVPAANRAAAASVATLFCSFGPPPHAKSFDISRFNFDEFQGPEVINH